MYDKRPMMSGAVAKAAGVSPAAVTYWVLTGKLIPLTTTTTGQRLFDPDDVARLIAARSKRAA